MRQSKGVHLRNPFGHALRTPSVIVDKKIANIPASLQKPRYHREGRFVVFPGGRVTETEPDPAMAEGLLAQLAQAEADPTGVDTFRRYVWQAKQAVRQWLTCLSKQDGPTSVVCELVEDLVLVYPARLRFLQLKTRDRGSWSASSMCDRGIDALVRSYNAAREVDLHRLATFELWLEGPISEGVDTVAFVADPSSASEALRSKIRDRGLKAEWVDDFLCRLAIYPDQPTRAHIDAKVMWELSALWPSQSRPELEQIYERLLLAATAAQAADTVPASVQAHLSAAWPYIDHDLPEPGSPGANVIDPIRKQVLSRSALVALTPPMPGESIEVLLGRISAGSSTSVLELKMRAAGATPSTIRQAQDLRADMEVERQLLLASRDSAEADLERLAHRVLIVANATASKIKFEASSNPSAAARPAEAIAVDLLSRPSDLAQCDRDLLFGSDGQLIYGFIGHLSDVCRFPWRAA